MFRKSFEKEEDISRHTASDAKTISRIFEKSSSDTIW